MESCLSDYSDYPLEVLRLSGGFFCDFGSDFEIQNRQRLSTMTHHPGTFREFLDLEQKPAQILKRN